MPLRTRLARAVVATLIIVSALVSVGITAPADAPFSIGLRAIFLGIDVDIKIGTAHIRFNWSAIPLTSPTTKSASTLL